MPCFGRLSKNVSPARSGVAAFVVGGSLFGRSLPGPRRPGRYGCLCRSSITAEAEAEAEAESDGRAAGCVSDLDGEGWRQEFPGAKEFDLGFIPADGRSKWLEYLEEVPAAVEPLRDTCQGVQSVTTIPESFRGKRKGRRSPSCEMVCDNDGRKLASSWTKTKRMSSSSRASLESDTTPFTHSYFANQEISSPVIHVNAAKTLKSPNRDLCRSWPLQNLIQGSLFHKPSANLTVPKQEIANTGFEIAAKRTSKWEEYLLPENENLQGGMLSKVCDSWGSKSCLEGSDKVEFHDLVKTELTSAYPDELVDEEVYPHFF